MKETTCLMHFALRPISHKISQTLSSEVAVLITRLESNTFWLTFKLYLLLSKDKNYESISPTILL